MAEQKPLAPQTPAIMALLLLAVIWGYNWVVMKLGVQYAAPFDFAAMRAFFGALSLFLVMLALRKPLKPPAFKMTLLLGVLQTSGMIGLSTWALVSGGAGKTSILCYTMPFWILLFAWLLLGERLHKAQWLHVALALTGLVLIVLPLNLTDASLSKVLAILAGMSWGMSAIVVKKITQNQTVDLISLTAWQMLLGSIPLILVSLFLPSPPVQWTGTFIAALLFNIIPGTAIAYLLWMFALKNLPAGTAGLGTLANPVIGVLAAAMQLGEIPDLTEAIGMILIVIALTLNVLQAMKPQQPIAAPLTSRQSTED
ncbi:MAG TPA: EamA family transporter [Coleofasciculaceae cyanobacterium]